MNPPPKKELPEGAYVGEALSGCDAHGGAGHGWIPSGAWGRQRERDPPLRCVGVSEKKGVAYFGVLKIDMWLCVVEQRRESGGFVLSQPSAQTAT